MAGELKITCKLDTNKLIAVKGALSDRTLRRVVAKSLNRAGVTVRKEAAQKIKKTLRLKVSEIKKALPIRNKPRSDQPIDRQYVEIGAAAQGISLSKFSPKQTGSGVKVNITGKPTVVKSAFLAQMKNASRGSVFIRKRAMAPGTKVRRVGKARKELPIAKMAGVSIHTKLMQHRIALAKTGKERFGKELATNYSYEIKKLA